jgi:alpha-tubulin suppressor-like RCC1 family protein
MKSKQLGGIGTSHTDYSNFPIQVRILGIGFLTGVTAIAAGEAHSLALLFDGSIFAWGYNEYGQLGTGDNIKHSAPQTDNSHRPVHRGRGQ